jgi:predicted phosphate transport protein (TIGR00153 family)
VRPSAILTLEVTMRWFLPKDDGYFDLLRNAAANMVKGARLFRAMLDDMDHIETSVEGIKRVEHEGDRITHATIERLHRSFVTPFDREDIHALVSRFDDVLDVLDATARRMLLFGVDAVPPGFILQADLLVSATGELEKALTDLFTRRTHPEARQHCIEVNRLENEADAVFRAAVVELFADTSDPIRLIKLKEICELLEKACDRCEDVADVIEGIVIKGS